MFINQLFESAYSDGVSDGIQGRANPRASSIYGPESNEYHRGYADGVVKGKEQKQARVAQAKADEEPYENMSTAELEQILADIQQRTNERHKIYSKLRGADYSFDPKRHLPPNDADLKVQSAADNKAWNTIHQVLWQRKQQGISEAGSPAQQAAIAVAMKKAGKKPKSEDIDEEKVRLDPKCWTGYHKAGTKMKGGVRVNNCVKNEDQNVAEGAEFGAYYSEQLAQRVFDANPNLDDEDAILNAGYAIAKKEMGSRANGIFRNEDFPSDFVSAYGWLKKNQGVAEGSLKEFAPGGDEGNSPYAYAIALKEMARLYAEGAFDYDVAPGSKKQNESDAEDISQVADAFMNKGMEAGREAYNMVDTGVRDEMDSYLKDQGFNVQNDIHAEYQKDVERYRNSPQGQAQARAQAAKDAEYAKGAPARKANEVVISAIDATTGEEEFSKISFDRRSVSPEQLRAKIQRSVAELKQHFVDYPGGNRSERIIKVTIGGKPVDIDKGVNEVSDATLTSYLTKVHADSQKHEKDPTKRSPEKRNRSVQGFARAFNKLDARKEKTESSDRDPGALASRAHIASQERKHQDWAAKQKELEDEFYANHPELDDRHKTVDNLVKEFSEMLSRTK